MCGAYSVLTALFIVTSSQVAAESGHSLQTFDHDVIAASNAVAKPLPNRFLRGNRNDHDDLANEERSVYSVLASMINEGIEKLPRVAEIIKVKPRAAKAKKKTPPAADPASNAQPRPEVVKELLYATEAREEMEKSKKYDALRLATEAAGKALQKHWTPSGEDVRTGDASRDISGNVIYGLKEWKVSFHGMRPMEVSDKHEENIKRIRAVFANLCGDNVNPTYEETSHLWSMMGWNKKHPKHKRKKDLVYQAQRHVLLAMQRLKGNEVLWKQWKNSPESVRFGVLNYLLNLHYQRWVRMYNIFNRNRLDRFGAQLNLKFNPAGNTGTSSALALRAHSKVQSSHPSKPLNGASKSRSDRAVVTQQSKRTFDGNVDTTSRPAKQSKMQNLKSVMPLVTRLTASGDHSASAKRSSFSFGGPSHIFVPYKPGGPSRIYVPYKPGDHSSMTSNSRLSLGGPSSGFAPNQHPNVHNSHSLTPPSTALTPPSTALTPPSTALTPPSTALTPPSTALMPPSTALTPPSTALTPPSTALTLKDIDTELSLGGIYDKSTYKTPSAP